VIGRRFRRPGDATVWTVESTAAAHVGLEGRAIVYVLRAGGLVRLATHQVLTSAAWVPA
jgi:hypothetical protein